MNSPLPHPSIPSPSFFRFPLDHLPTLLFSFSEDLRQHILFSEKSSFSHFLSYSLPDNSLLCISQQFYESMGLLWGLKEINIKPVALNKCWLLILFSLDTILISLVTLHSSFFPLPSWRPPQPLIAFWFHLKRYSLPSYFISSFFPGSRADSSLLFPFIKTCSWEVCINMHLLPYWMKFTFYLRHGLLDTNKTHPLVPQ